MSRTIPTYQFARMDSPGDVAPSLNQPPYLSSRLIYESSGEVGFDAVLTYTAGLSYSGSTASAHAANSQQAFRDLAALLPKIEVALLAAIELKGRALSSVSSPLYRSEAEAAAGATTKVVTLSALNTTLAQMKTDLDAAVAELEATMTLAAS